MEVLEPSVIFEAKDGKYGEDGSDTLITIASTMRNCSVNPVIVV